ncbi:MAG: DUF2029 domain-containing protein, partial [Planctomycetales bacterium]|nr:DUF2029 domain-containing protein [Planctomycetales bacterium]
VTTPWPLYSPGALPAAGTLALLPIRGAEACFFLATLALMVAVAAFSLKAANVPVAWPALIGLTSLLLLSRPGHIGLYLGQVAAPMAWASLAAIAWGRRRPWLAAAALAASSWKPTFGVPLAGLLWMSGARRAAVGGAVLGTLSALVGLAPLVWRMGVASLLESASSAHATNVGAVPLNWTRLDLASGLARTFGHAPPGWLILLCAGVCLAPASWTLRRLQTVDQDASAGVNALGSRSGLICCLATLSCVFHNTYDALLIAPGWAAVVVGPLGASLGNRWRWSLGALLTIPAVNYLSTRAFLDRFVTSEGAATLLSVVNPAAVFLALAVACVEAELFVRRRSSERSSTRHVLPG